MIKKGQDWGLDWSGLVRTGQDWSEMISAGHVRMGQDVSGKEQDGLGWVRAGQGWSGWVRTGRKTSKHFK